MVMPIRFQPLERPLTFEADGQDTVSERRELVGSCRPFVGIEYDFKLGGFIPIERG